MNNDQILFEIIQQKNHKLAPKQAKTTKMKKMVTLYIANCSTRAMSIKCEAQLDVAEQCIKQILTTAIINKDKNFGNARFVRNLFEKTLENQAMRLASVGKLTSETL